MLWKLAVIITHLMLELCLQAATPWPGSRTKSTGSPLLSSVPLWSTSLVWIVNWAPPNKWVLVPSATTWNYVSIHHAPFPYNWYTDFETIMINSVVRRHIITNYTLQNHHTIVAKLISGSMILSSGPMKSMWIVGSVIETVFHPWYMSPVLLSPTCASILTFRPSFVFDFLITCSKGKLNFQIPLNWNERYVIWQPNRTIEFAYKEQNMVGVEIVVVFDKIFLLNVVNTWKVSNTIFWRLRGRKWFSHVNMCPFWLR